MGKYSKYKVQRSEERPWKIHPIWRGIGCFLLVLVPVMAYAAAVLVSDMNQQNGWFRVPEQLQGSLNLGQVYRTLPALARMIPGLGRVPYLHLALTIGFIVVGFGLISVLYSVLYGITGAKHQSPVDAPTIRRSPHRKLR